MDIVGNRYGRWLVIGEQTKDKKCLCVCDCGTVKNVNVTNLISGKTHSCGCLISEVTMKRNLTHGGSKTRLYCTWSNVKRRCNDKKNSRYNDYGGRGIRLCNEWLEFDNFRKWAIENGYDENSKYGECTLERIDNNRNYEPSNCKFASIKEQSNNRRSNHLLTFNGITRNITQWNNEMNYPRNLISTRIRRGWSDEKAITTPVGGCV